MEIERTLLVLYGTQTGTAKEVAERIAREGKRRHFHSKSISLDNFSVAELPYQQLVVFVVATTGQGEVPDNMKNFWRTILQKKIPANALQNVKFAVFGLGDSSYAQFNFVGKKLYNRLVQIGAEPIFKRGDGDDQHRLGLEGVLDPWLIEFWNTLLKLYPLPPHKEILPANVLPPPKYKVVYGTSEDLPSTKPLIHSENSTEFSQQNPYYAKLKSNTRITSEDWEQEVRHLVLDLGDSKITYEPGDVVYVLPSNIPKDALEFISYMGYDPNTVIKRFEPMEEDVPPSDLPTPSTVLELITSYFDIMGTPRRHFFELLRFFATASHEIEKLEEFSSTEGQEDLRSYCHKVHRTVFEVLKDFPSVKIPLEYLFEVLPRIQARPFSISSSLKFSPSEIHITMAVVTFKIGKRTRKGVCSTWLASLDASQETRVPIWIRRGLTKLPEASKPVIMVGPGTGCAMFRSFTQERDSLQKTGPIGQMGFFFGCRHEKKDFLHGEEWKHFIEKGTLSLLGAAFSRDQKQKVYVQHLITQNSKPLWKMIQDGAIIYVSGNAKRMPIDVREAFRDVIKMEGNMSNEDADQYLKQLEKGRRYQVETWN